MTYIDDEVEGIASVINSAAHNTVVNVSTQEELSVLEMAHIIAEEMGRADHPFTFLADRKTQTKKERIDASKAHALCGWKAKWTFREGKSRVTPPYVLEFIDEFHMTHEEDLAKIIFADIDDHLLRTTGVKCGIWK
ncbi:hypothetical protein BG003_001415 [Podila horticola]|nr:hypothetical protein BG003_001415 [Podila horticola]